MHFKIPYTVLKHRYAETEVEFTLAEHASCELEVKIDGNRILFKGTNEDGEVAWLEAEKVKD